ncbi:LptA/OstA family protein [Bartonella sp. B41]
MEPRASYIKWVSMYLVLVIGILLAGIVSGHSEISNFGINLFDGKDSMEFYADSLEVRDREGIALFNGNVSVIQGKHLLRTSKLVVHYDKVHKVVDKSQKNMKTKSSVGFGLVNIQRMEALGSVYIKIATKVATGDKGIFDEKSGTMTLTGSNVVLIDGDNVVTGCKLVTNLKTRKTFLEGCEASKKKNSVSVVFKLNKKNGY